MEQAARERRVRYYVRFVREHTRRPAPTGEYWDALVSPAMRAIDLEWKNVEDILSWVASKPSQPGMDATLLELMLHLVHYLDSRLHNRQRIRYLKAAVAAASRLGRRETEALLRIDALGWTHVEEHQFDDAEREIQRGMEIALQLDGENSARADLLALGYAWRARVVCERPQPGPVSLEAATSLFTASALALHRSPVVKYRVNLAIGDIMLKSKRPREALAYYEEMRRLSDGYGGEGRGYQIGWRIGEALRMSGDFNGAEREFTKLQEDETIPVGKLYGKYGAAWVALGRGDVPRAC